MLNDSELIGMAVAFLILAALTLIAIGAVIVGAVCFSKDFA